MALSSFIYGFAIATNAVFTNVLPDFCREIKHYELPVECPFKAEELAWFCYNEEEKSYTIRLKSGWEIELNHGHLTYVTGPDYPADRYRPKTGDKCRVTLSEAMKIATNFVARAGLPDNLTWVHLRPEVEKAKLPIVPYYEFTWYSPHEEDSTSVEVAVDCRDGKIVFAAFWCLLGKLVAEHSKGQSPDRLRPPDEAPTEDVQIELVRQAVLDLKKWSAKLGLPGELLDEKTIRAGITEWIKLCDGAKTNSWEILVRSAGWQLNFQEGKLIGWTAPDAFFDSESPPDLKQVAGKWQLSEKRAIEMVRNWIRELGLSHEGLKAIFQQPRVRKPNLRGPPTVPRYHFEWLETKPLGKSGYRYGSIWITAEVDAERKRITHLSIYLAEKYSERILF